MSEKFCIRDVNIKDITNVFDLSNDDVVRQNSINKEKIVWENHVNWFNNRIKKTEEPFYIVESLNGDFIGQVRIENRNEENVVSVSITKDYRGKGLCAEILKEAVNKSGMINFTAYIFKDNISSVKSFEKAGFNFVIETEIPHTELKDIKLLKYTFKRSN